MTTDPRKLIQEARELDAKATPHFWGHSTLDTDPPREKVWHVGGDIRFDYGRNAFADAHFISRSRTLLVELADALEESERQLELHRARVVHVDELEETFNKIRAARDVAHGKLSAVVGLLDEWKYNESVPVKALEKALEGGGDG